MLLHCTVEQAIAGDPETAGARLEIAERLHARRYLRPLEPLVPEDVQLHDGAELTVFVAEIKSAMEAYLARRGDPQMRSSRPRPREH